MVFIPEEDVFKLSFKDAKYAGLEVVVKSLSTGDLTDMMSLSTKADNLTSTTKVIKHLANALESWNLAYKDGSPVPTTYEGINSQSLPLVTTIVSAWVEAVAGVSESLGKDLPSGKPFPEALIPMATS